MLSATSTVRTGQYAEAIAGVGLQGPDVQALRTDRDNAAALGQAIREALQRARLEGLSAFAPDTGTLQVDPSLMSLATLRDIFSTVLGVPYAQADEAPGLPPYGPLSLPQWSQAEATLATQVARDASMLPAEQGGGAQYARGRWYVNGEPYTTAELFYTVRIGNLGNLDQELATNLNTLSANTRLARQVMALLAEMKPREDLRRAEAEAAHQTDIGPVFDGHDDFTVLVEDAGLTVPEVMDIGRRFKGPDSYLVKVGGLALQDTPTHDTNIAGVDYAGSITELQAIFDSINSENDVKKLRVDSLQNSRTSMLEGLSGYLAGARTQALTVERNLR